MGERTLLPPLWALPPPPPSPPSLFPPSPHTEDVGLDDSHLSRLSFFTQTVDSFFSLSLSLSLPSLLPPGCGREGRDVWRLLRLRAHDDDDAWATVAVAVTVAVVVIAAGVGVGDVDDDDDKDGLAAAEAAPLGATGSTRGP